MARIARGIAAEIPHHITQRGNAQNAHFFPGCRLPDIH
jgi:hypothetical protein